MVLSLCPRGNSCSAGLNIHCVSGGFPDSVWQCTDLSDDETHHGIILPVVHQQDAASRPKSQMHDLGMSLAETATFTSTDDGGKHSLGAVSARLK